MNNSPRRPLPYIPGIISALCLPLLFLVYADTRVEPGYEYALPVYWFNPHLVEKHPEAFLPGIFPERSWLDIRLNGRDDEDRVKLEFFRLHLREILRCNDSVNAVRLHFGDNASYWTFVKAVDICRTEGAKFYWPSGNVLRVWQVARDPEADVHLPYFTCGTSYQAEVQRPTFPWGLAWSSSWPLIAGMAILMFFCVRSLCLRSQSR